MVCKKPAAHENPSAGHKVRKERFEKVRQCPKGSTVQLFSLQKHIKNILEHQKLQVASPAACFSWGSSFDGTNGAAYVLSKLGIRHMHQFGAERKLAAALFSLKKFKVAHLFEDTL